MLRIAIRNVSIPQRNGVFIHERVKENIDTIALKIALTSKLAYPTFFEHLVRRLMNRREHVADTCVYTFRNGHRSVFIPLFVADRYHSDLHCGYHRNRINKQAIRNENRSETISIRNV